MVAAANTATIAGLWASSSASAAIRRCGSVHTRPPMTVRTAPATGRARPHARPRCRAHRPSLQAGHAEHAAQRPHQADASEQGEVDGLAEARERVADARRACAGRGAQVIVEALALEQELVVGVDGDAGQLAPGGR